MDIGIPRETSEGENRVAVIPAVMRGYLGQHRVLVERGAGLAASIPDSELEKAGAVLVDGSEALYQQSRAIVKVQPPRVISHTGVHEASLVPEGGVYLGFLAPFTNRDAVETLARRGVTSFAMELVPRITRAQSMDALSSMATVAGYKAVLIAADRCPKMFPLLMTAAGTIHPAVVLVLGAGVAGLQAIATAKRLGAKVEAFDPRPAAREQVKSLGASFVEMELPADAETAGGYAKDLGDEFLRLEQEAIAARLPRIDVVICTAQVFGKRAPVLITNAMISKMKPGAVIVDLAAEQGGNCEATRAGESVVVDGVTVLGTVNVPSSLPGDASAMYARNVQNLFLSIYPKQDSVPNFDDEVVRGCCVTRDGRVIHPAVLSAWGLS